MVALGRSSHYGGTRARDWRASESPPESWAPFASCGTPWSKPHPMLADSRFRGRLTSFRFWSCSCLLIVFTYFSVVTASTDSQDETALTQISGSWKNIPSDWVGNDPCGSRWSGITCKGSRIASIELSSSGLAGELTGDVGSLTELETLDLSYNKDLRGTLPYSIGKLTKLTTLNLAGCSLFGPIPDLGNLQKLSGLDLSNNNFDPSDVPPSLLSLTSLTTLFMENTSIRNEVPEGLLALPQLQTLRLKSNSLNGTVELGAGHSRKLRLVDLQNNEIEDVRVDGGYGGSLILVGNPYCDRGERGSSMYCEQARVPSYYTYPGPSDCQADCSCGHPGSSLSPSCTCAYPYEGNLTFRSTSFSDLGDESNYEELVTNIRDFFRSQKVPVDSVALLDVAISSENYLGIRLQIFPSGAACFNHASLSTLGRFLSTQTYLAPKQFGSYFFEARQSKCDEVKIYCTSKHKKHWVIIGASSIGAFLFAAAIAFMAVHVVRRRREVRRVERSGLFASWRSVQGGGDAPNIRGTKSFSFDEMKRSTGNFSESNYVGTGSYGKVYKGMLETGQLVAIKRAQLGFGQGGHEFKTEIELLSRLHHKNIVALVGFCFDQGEQILVYEYIPNGNLRDSLSEKSGIHLDWRRRLKTALGISRGLAYLHELADPPLIHRDVKSNNVLLDDRLNAKLADFGLCKSLSDVLQDHVTTQVKGTMGYLDPEYYMTQQLTEKSDVYSFGVLLLELVTARRPIEKGKYIVTEVRASVDRSKDLYGLGKLLDPWLMTSASKISGLERFIDLAMRCLRDSSVDRPSMTQVVKEIEGILLSSGVDPYADQYSSRASTRCNEEGSSGSRAEDLDFSMVPALPR